MHTLEQWVETKCPPVVAYLTASFFPDAGHLVSAQDYVREVWDTASIYDNLYSGHMPEPLPMERALACSMAKDLALTGYFQAIRQHNVHGPLTLDDTTLLAPLLYEEAATALRLKCDALQAVMVALQQSKTCSLDLQREVATRCFAYLVPT